MNQNIKGDGVKIKGLNGIMSKMKKLDSPRTEVKFLEESILLHLKTKVKIPYWETEVNRNFRFCLGL
jgi:hypothetical protein